MNEKSIAQRALARHEVDYPPEGVIIGNGWDSQLGRKTSVKAVVFEEIDEPSPSQRVQYEISQVLDRNSLLATLNVSAEGSYEGWGGKVSAKAEFARRVEVSELFQSFVAHAVVNNVARFAAPLETAIDLEPEYAELARRDPAEFRRRCGDCLYTGPCSTGTLTTSNSIAKSGPEWYAVSGRARCELGVDC